MAKRPLSKATREILRETQRAQDEKNTVAIRFGCGVLLAIPLGLLAAIRAGTYAVRHHLDVDVWAAIAAIVTVVTVVRVTTYGTDAELMELIRRRGGGGPRV